MNVVECQALKKTYGSRKALHDVTLRIDGQKITGLVGPNGAGKTTLLKIIAGYWRESSGEIKVFSAKPFNNLFVSANTIFIDDDLHLPDALNLSQILAEAGRFYPNWDTELAERFFTYFSFHPDQYYPHLSKGMKSTFNMILGLAARCALTIFDEPTTGMDASVRKDFYRAVLKAYMAYPRTIIISSHYVNEIEDLLEDIMLLKDGRLLLHVPMAELKEWAVAVQGPTTVLQAWIQDKEIIHEERLGSDLAYAVVRNAFGEQELTKARLSGLNVSAVNVSDLCTYLTNERKRGIDDVFDRSEFI